MKTRLIIPILCCLTLAGCGADNSGSNLNSSSSEESEESLSVHEINKDIEVGDSLIDFAIGKVMAAGSSYKISFSFDEADNTDPIVEVSDESKVTVEKNVDGSFSLNAIKKGQVILTIRDSTQIIHYRRVVRVANPLSQTEMEDYLVNVDHFQSWLFAGTDLTLTFLDADDANISGTDEGTAIGGINFTYAYDRLDGDEYVFSIDGFTNNASTLNPTSFRIYTTGELLHLMQGSGESVITSAVFTPSMTE